MTFPASRLGIPFQLSHNTNSFGNGMNTSESLIVFVFHSLNMKLCSNEDIAGVVINGGRLVESIKRREGQDCLGRISRIRD